MTRVIALIAHLGRDAGADAWLAGAIDSLLAQTVPLLAILVVDDASPHAPDALLARYPSVSLYRNASNSGPFAIDDAVFATVDADAVLMQDSDDWSLPERLQLLLAEFHTGAELVGSQIHHVAESGHPATGPDLDRLPLDPRPLLLEQPTAHTLLFPSALVSVALARRLGGFSSALRFGADPEFVRRAVFGGRVRNIDASVYVRRLHPQSLTRAAETGFGSPARLAVQARVQASARRLVAAVQAGEAPDLEPLDRGPATTLTHVCGPRIAGL